MDDKGIGVSGPGAALLLEDPVGAVERLFASRRQPSSRVVADIHVRMPRAGKAGSLRRVVGGSWPEKRRDTQHDDPKA